MSIDEFKESDWYKTRPEIIKQAIELLPPTQLWKFKDSGKQCQLYSYGEPKSGKLEDVTVTVICTGIGGAMADMGMGELTKCRVFGVPLDDLEPWKDYQDEN